MKIGIITFWQSNDNYGQLLQCWALQQQLIEMGYNPYLIRYNYAQIKEKDPYWKKIARFLLIRPYFKRRRKNILDKKIAKKNEERHFDDFRNNCLITSDNYYDTADELIDNPPEADAYITGSDQVWAQLLNNKRSFPFFLRFGDRNVRRISYAPSFAMKEYPRDLENILYDSLRQFDSISVRELEGKSICKRMGFNVEHVVDPTLLLPRSSYSKIICKNALYDHPFLYIYSINIKNAEEIRWGELKHICENQQLEVLVTPASGYIQGLELFGNNVKYDYASIPKWLSNISNARMLVTTSFHGVAFSLLFHCPVIYVPLNGEFGFGNNRAIDLLKRVGLEHRILQNNTSFMSLFSEIIDWNYVDNKLSTLKMLSINYLRNSLG